MRKPTKTRATTPTRTAADARRRKQTVTLAENAPFPCHGAVALDGVRVTSYNIELRDGGGFVGDRAAKSAFFERLDALRASARARGADPFGSTATAELSKKAIERTLRRGAPAAAALVHAAIDEHAHALIDVIGRFRRVLAWRKLRSIVVGGGFSEGRVGELVIARAQSLLDENGETVALRSIERDPDEAGLAGAVHLVPPWILRGFDAMLAVDLGGSNVRCGIVTFRPHTARIRAIRVADMQLWRHVDDDASRTALADELVAMLRRLARRARKDRRKLAPLVGIGCPGLIAFDGHIERGAQNLPGEWHRRHFHLPSVVRDGLGEIAGQRVSVIMHNDAVVQGLGELSRMRDAQRWGILTIGTGLGNATFEMPDAKPAKPKRRKAKR